jgi:peptidylprolyl isomerase
MTRSLVAALLAAVALLTGCGSPAPAPAAAPGGVPALSGDPADVTKPTQAAAGSGAAPSTLVTKDVVAGKGPAAQGSDTVAVRYTGTLWTDGTLFDSSWKRGTDPISFPLNQVVPGFAQGIAGMQAGGRRVLVIPPALGYGDQAKGPIPGGSTLVFVVDLVKIGS